MLEVKRCVSGENGPILWGSRSGELRTQKLKSHLVRTQSLNVLPLKLVSWCFEPSQPQRITLPLKPGVGQHIAIHALLTARDFFLAYFYPSSPFTCIFSKTSPNFFATLTAKDFFLAYFYPSGPFICIFSKTSPDFFLFCLWLTPVPV